MDRSIREHRLYHEFLEFQKIIEQQDHKRYEAVLNHSLSVMEILRRGTLREEKL